jgi:hypothetical protein
MRMFADNPLHVSGRARPIPQTALTHIDQNMRFAGHGKFVQRRIAGHNRRIHQRFIVHRSIMVRSGGSRGHSGDARLPCPRQHQPHFMGTRSGFRQRQEGSRTVEQRKIPVHPIVLHGHLMAIDAVLHRNGASAPGLNPPPVLRVFFNVQANAQAASVDGLCSHRFQVLGELADDIRRPDCHLQLDLTLSGGRHRSLHFHIVSLRLRDLDGITNRLQRLAGAHSRQDAKRQETDPESRPRRTEAPYTSRPSTCFQLWATLSGEAALQPRLCAALPFGS